MCARNLPQLLLSVTAMSVIVLSGCNPTPALSEGLPGAPQEAGAVVESFYRWHLGYPGNAMADGAYQTSEYLTGEFVAEVDELVASFDRGAYDPFLCAQDIPQTFSLDEAVVSGEEATIVVHEVWNAGTEFETVNDVEVALHLLDGRWMIEDVECARGEEVVPPQQGLPEATPPEGWSVFRDETYGVEIQYPVEWTPQEVELRYPELDAPVVRIVHFLPREWADQMNPAGPPDPHDVIVAPLGLEISVGSLGEYRHRYGEPATRETLEINGTTVVREQEALGDSYLVRYVFEHPADETLRVTLVDQISGFSARVEGNAAVVDVVEQILSTFVFQW